MSKGEVGERCVCTRGGADAFPNKVGLRVWAVRGRLEIFLFCRGGRRVIIFFVSIAVFVGRNGEKGGFTVGCARGLASSARAPKRAGSVLSGSGFLEDDHLRGARLPPGPIAAKSWP